MELMTSVPDSTKRTIAVVTSSRADYGHLYWVLKELQARPQVEVRLMVTGAHLRPEFGLTSRVIEADGFTIDDRIECLGDSDTETAAAQAIGRATIGFAHAFDRQRPDLLLLIADRFEMLGPANAALAMRIPIAHIEGGERSEGAIDNAIRNALTMMSHVHLTTTESAKAKIIAMGEEAWRVHRVGAPSLDHLKRSTLPDRQALESRIGLNLQTPPLLVAHHPVTLDPDPAHESIALFEALANFISKGAGTRPIVFCFPNADSGNLAIRSRAEAFCASNENAKLIVNLEPPMYWGLMHHVAALVGNSSSGIMESASIPIPAVNIGRRQRGREQPACVIDVPANAETISNAIALALDPDFRGSLQGIVNPYGDGDAARRIATILGEIPIDARLLNKTTDA
ncbi:MAG: UDP-N-acetylglucosamine 2-epimerase [Planctomycetota bacterium]|nr:UDP-N-acetylglucosamine 2-epimerase [Planctomycetota bacterium]